jgi:hypothetical protein
VSVHIVTDEADAVLAILAKKKVNQLITEADWQRLFPAKVIFASRNGRRQCNVLLKTQSSNPLSFPMIWQRAQFLAETLAKWKGADVSRAAGLALAYLPQAARIQAKIYPEIKPKTNSFVFDVKTDPAISILTRKLAKKSSRTRSRMNFITSGLAALVQRRKYLKRSPSYRKTRRMFFSGSALSAKALRCWRRRKP